MVWSKGLCVTLSPSPCFNILFQKILQREAPAFFENRLGRLCLHFLWKVAWQLKLSRRRGYWGSQGRFETNKPSKRTQMVQPTATPEGLLKHRLLAQPQFWIPVGLQHPLALASDHAVAGGLGSTPRTTEQQMPERTQVPRGRAGGLWSLPRLLRRGGQGVRENAGGRRGVTLPQELPKPSGAGVLAGPSCGAVVSLERSPSQS